MFRFVAFSALLCFSSSFAFTQSTPTPIIRSEIVSNGWKEYYYAFRETYITWKYAISWEKESPDPETIPVRLLEACREGNLPKAAALEFELQKLERLHLSESDAFFVSLSEEEQIELATFRESLLKEAKQYLKSPTESWASETLLKRLFDPRIRDLSLARNILPNFSDDHIQYNGIRSAEIYLVGLRKNREAFLKPLLARLREVTERDKDNQEELFLLGLALGAVLSTEENYTQPGVNFWSVTEYTLDYRENPMEGLNRTEVETLISASVKLQGDGWWRTGDQVQTNEIHNMARLFLEESYPWGQRELEERVLNKSFYGWESMWVLGLHLNHDPEDLFANHQELFIEVIRQSHYSHWGNYPRAIKIGNLFKQNSNECLEHPIFGPTAPKPYGRKTLFRSRALQDWNGEFWPLFIKYHDRVASILQRAIEQETNTYHQLCLVEALHGVGNNESKDFLTHYDVSNLASDEYMLNAGFSQRRLRAMEDEAIPYLRAGMNSGVEVGDHQIIAYCDELLVDLDPTYNRSEWPEVHEFMWSQMADDDTWNNGIVAYYYFVNWGEEALAFLETRENPDEQQIQKIARLRRHLGLDEVSE